MKAVWKGKVLAYSEQTKVVEGRHYFPPENVVEEFLKPSNHTSQCPWKGTASYYNVHVGDEKNKNAAWSYHEPRPAAAEIAGHVTFWKGIEILPDQV